MSCAENFAAVAAAGRIAPSPRAWRPRGQPVRGRQPVPGQQPVHGRQPARGRWSVRALVCGTALGLVPALLHAQAPSDAVDRGSSSVVSSGAPAGLPDSLPQPATFRNETDVPGRVEVTLVAAPARLALLSSHPAEVYAYNGQVPGPTLELHEGDRVTIHFRNELPEPTTVHWHGLHLPAASDGSPLQPVPARGHYDYSFTVLPGSAGTYWYHPHPDRRGGAQLARGLYGAIVIRPRSDPLEGIPERLLILADNRFRPDGSLDFPDPQSLQGTVDAENGREGDIVFVNGRIRPSLTLPAGGLERWRVINASAARVYRLAIPGRTLVHVGNDGGLFEHPVEVGEILVANAERVELLVRADGPAGSRMALQSLPYDRYTRNTRPPDWDRPRDLLALEVGAPAPGPPPSIPPVLREVPALDPARATATRVVVLSQGLINGRTMDMQRVDIRAKLGATEIWQVENVVGMDHPFHLHGFQFQVLDRDGVPEPFRSWKDTVNVPRHSVVHLIVRYTDYAGKWMFHCHIMDHEDQGMMGILEVN